MNLYDTKFYETSVKVLQSEPLASFTLTHFNIKFSIIKNLLFRYRALFYMI